MENTEPPSNSKAMYWTGWVVGALPALLLILSGIFKVSGAGGDEAVREVTRLGWTPSLMGSIGILEILVAVIYLIPQTSVLGAILVTGYMGGAIATHVRISDPFYVQVLIPVMFWVGLWLREPRIRELIPIYRTR
jgi:hypothetical protein